jgi:hypothetical protein
MEPFAMALRVWHPVQNDKCHNVYFCYLLPNFFPPSTVSLLGRDKRVTKR